MRVAHLSDVHILEAHADVHSTFGWSTRVVSYARALEPRAREKKLKRAIVEAVRLGATHVVISGDLTEIGSAAQFEAFANVLHDSKIAPENITLVPGNHDAYTSPDGWKRALGGPLAPFRASSAASPGQIVDRGGVIFLPVDSSCFQSIARSGGEVTDVAASIIEKRLDDPAHRDKAIVVVSHHPPFAHKLGAWNWIDGLRGSARFLEALRRHAHVHVLHGHLHRIVDRFLGRCRVFGTSAVVDDGDTPRVRLFDLSAARASW